MNSPFRLLSGGVSSGQQVQVQVHGFTLATTTLLLLIFFFVNNPIVVVLARPQDPLEMGLVDLPQGRKPISQEDQIAKWKSRIGSTCSWQNFDGGHWVAPNTCDAKAAKGECICPLYFQEQREDAGFISTIIQCCVPAPCADPNLPRGSSCMDSTKGDLCFGGSGRFVSNTYYGKSCPNFPENIECCVNSDDPPPSQLEQLLQQMMMDDHPHHPQTDEEESRLDNHNSPNANANANANANLWALSDDALSWLDRDTTTTTTTTPLDTWY